MSDLHTEEEARQKWCPFARVGPPNGAGNRYSRDTDYAEKTAFATCIASDCMAWRWVDWQQNSAVGANRPDGEGWEKIGNFWTRTPKPGDAWRPGYCGLAGEP